MLRWRFASRSYLKEARLDHTCRILTGFTREPWLFYGSSILTKGSKKNLDDSADCSHFTSQGSRYCVHVRRLWRSKVDFPPVDFFWITRQTLQVKSFVSRNYIRLSTNWELSKKNHQKELLVWRNSEKLFAYSYDCYSSAYTRSQNLPPGNIDQQQWPTFRWPMLPRARLPDPVSIFWKICLGSWLGQKKNGI